MHLYTATEKTNLDRNVYDSLALKALCSSQKVTKFQHQMALSLADHLMKHQRSCSNEDSELLRQFQMLDMDGDGVISPKELEIFFKHTKYKNTVAEIILRADLDHDDRVSYREILVLALERVSWNAPLRREELSKQVGLSSSDVDIIQQKVQQRRSVRPSTTPRRTTTKNIQDAARRSSRRKQKHSIGSTHSIDTARSIDITAQHILQEASDLLAAYERAERSHRLGRHRASLMRRSKSITQQYRDLEIKYKKNKLKPELYRSIVRTMNQVSNLF